MTILMGFLLKFPIRKLVFSTNDILLVLEVRDLNVNVLPLFGHSFSCVRTYIGLTHNPLVFFYQKKWGMPI